MSTLSLSSAEQALLTLDNDPEMVAGILADPRGALAEAQAVIPSQEDTAAHAQTIAILQAHIAYLDANPEHWTREKTDAYLKAIIPIFPLAGSLAAAINLDDSLGSAIGILRSGDDFGSTRRAVAEVVTALMRRAVMAARQNAAALLRERANAPPGDMANARSELADMAKRIERGDRAEGH